MTAKTISVKDEMAKLKGYPAQTKRAILKARDELLALSPESKGIVKRALDGNESARRELPPEIAGEFDELRGLMADSETVNGVMLAALDAPMTAVITADSLTGESKNIVLEAFRKLNRPEAEKLATAL